MKPSVMLNRMCQAVLAQTDVKAICKARGFPPEAAKSRGILETLFLSSQGVRDVFDSLESDEKCLLHRLKGSGGSVDAVFFAGVYGADQSYGTFHQRFQGTFAKVHRRLVRNGVLLLAEASQLVGQTNSKMERWHLALPMSFRLTCRH